MRIVLTVLFSVLFISLKAQTQLPLVMPPAQMGFYPYTRLGDSTNNANKKWSFSKYAGISASVGFFNGGSATVFSAPVTLQVNRRLNNNLYAFGAVSVAPAYFNFNRSFNDPGINKNYPGYNQFNSNGLGMYSRAALGLMYVNDEKTFSISGSIGIERSYYPGFPSNRVHTQNSQAPAGSRQ